MSRLKRATERLEEKAGRRIRGVPTLVGIEVWRHEAARTGTFPTLSPADKVNVAVPACPGIVITPSCFVGQKEDHQKRA